MITRDRRDAWILAATGVLAIAVPLALAAHLRARVARLGPALSALTGEPSSIGGVEAGLTGTVRLRGVEIGDVLRADSIEASVGMDSLLSGDLGADEIRIDRPRLRAHVDGAGDSNVARILRHVAAVRQGRPGGGSGARRLRRIVVTEGDLVVDVVGVGRLEADDVELAPEGGGVRVVTGPVRVSAGAGAFAIDATFARAGGDLALPDARLQRFLAVGGTVDVAAGGASLAIDDAALGVGVWAPHTLGLRGTVDDAGVPHPIVATGTRAGLHVTGDGVPLAFLAPLAPRGVQIDGARASGTLTFARAPGGWSLDLDGAIAGARVDHPSLADQPVAIDGALGLTARGDADTIDVSRLHLAHGALALDGRARLRRGGPAGLAGADVDVTLADAPCADLIAALPAAIRGPLDALAIDGGLAGTAHLGVDLDAPPGEGVELAVDLDNRCRVVDDPPAADVRGLAGVADQTFPDGSRAAVGPGVGDWTALTELPAYVDGAFVSSEDARFYHHHGFDAEQIARSLEVDLREGRFARGGSTISQQLVKNAFLSQRRTLDRKLQEAVLTWRLEQVLSKRQILERYLNLIELGPSVYGVAAAARHWFGISPTDLTVKQAAFLAAMTSEPQSMTRRIVAAGGLDAESADRIDVVLRHMAHEGVIGDEERARARAESLDFRRDALSAPAVAAADQLTMR